MNIMMDAKPLYPVPYHPVENDMKRDFSGRAKHRTRTERPVRYYLIDFGLSRRYNPADGPPREGIILGADKTVPEFAKSNDPCDPFPTDVYYLGNCIRTTFLQVSRQDRSLLSFLHVANIGMGIRHGTVRLRFHVASCQGHVSR